MPDRKGSPWFHISISAFALLVLATGLSSPSTAATSTIFQTNPVDVEVESDGVKLVGSLHLPASNGPFPAVVLIHGSEPGERSSRGYTMMAEALNRRGIAALTSDKRGAGDSEGEYIEAPDLLLAVFGGADRIVPVEASIEAMRRAFAEDRRDLFTIKVFPGANHGIRITTESGDMSVPDDYPDFLLDWIENVLERGRD